MAKKSLYKLFYADAQGHMAEYEKRFNHEDTIHLDINIGEHQAFICQTIDIYKLIISIERTNHMVTYLCNQLPGIALSHFQMQCLIDEIILTNNIEGIYSTRKEISEILKDLSKNNKRKRFEGLVRKYVLLMRDEQIDLRTPENIRKIYDDIFYEEIKTTDPNDLPDGEIFRKSSVSVYSATDKEIHHGVYPESKIISIMEKSLDFLHDNDYDPLLRIAVFHYLFGYIHPFYDGNGRTSRFISSYLLSKNLNPLVGYRISSTIKEQMHKYYNSFMVCNHYHNKGELTPFVEMFLEIINISMEQLCEALLECLEKLAHYSKLIETLPNGNDEIMCQLYQLLLQAALFSEQGISQKELEDNMGMSYKTVKRRLALIPPNLLIIKRQKNQPFYQLSLKSIDDTQLKNL